MGASHSNKKDNPEGRPGIPARALRRVGATAAAVLVVCMMAFCPAVMASKSKAFQEYQLKAVFLYNLTNFVAWPPQALSSTDEPFRIVIFAKLGDIRSIYIFGLKI